MNTVMDFTAAERARRVRLILFDVDGGDDVIDLPVMRVCGLAIAVAPRSPGSVTAGWGMLSLWVEQAQERGQTDGHSQDPFFFVSSSYCRAW
jgi:hypothetical protein